jgi:phage-related protein
MKPKRYYDDEVRPELERRAAHRVVPAHAIPVQLLAPDGALLCGTVAAMSSRGMTVAAPLAGTASLAVDQVVELSAGAGSGEELVTPARVASARTLDERWAHLGLEFILVGGVHRQIERFFLAHGNRRAHARTAPLAQDVVRVQAQWPGGQLTARVHDVSVGGMALAISSLSAVTMTQGQALSLRFRLPGAVRSITGAAEVRYVADFPRRRVIGLAYDLSDPRGIARELEMIEAFVAERTVRSLAWDQSWTN